MLPRVIWKALRKVWQWIPTQVEASGMAMVKGSDEKQTAKKNVQYLGE